MGIGDLVRLQSEKIQGFGVIVGLKQPSTVNWSNRGLRLYWVLCGTGIKCFTGNQVTLI